MCNVVYFFPKAQCLQCKIHYITVVSLYFFPVQKVSHFCLHQALGFITGTSRMSAVPRIEHTPRMQAGMGTTHTQDVGSALIITILCSTCGNAFHFRYIESNSRQESYFDIRCTENFAVTKLIILELQLYCAYGQPIKRNEFFWVY